MAGGSDVGAEVHDVGCRCGVSRERGRAGRSLQIQELEGSTHYASWHLSLFLAALSFFTLSASKLTILGGGPHHFATVAAWTSRATRQWRASSAVWCLPIPCATLCVLPENRLPPCCRRCCLDPKGNKAVAGFISGVPAIWDAHIHNVAYNATPTCCLSP